MPPVKIATNREERRLSGLQRRKMLADRIVLLERKIAELTRQIARLSGTARILLSQQRAILVERKAKCEKMMADWIPQMLVTENREGFSREAAQNRVNVIAGEIGVNLFDNFGVYSGYFAPVINFVSDPNVDN